jgi:hypothetical protein
MQNKKLLAGFFIISMVISFIFPQTGSFKIGSIKYDYNNLEFSFSEGNSYGRDAHGQSVTVKIGKFSLSTSNSGAELSDNGRGGMHIGPSKVLIQNVDFDIYNNSTRENVKFDLGSFRFDLNQLNFDLNNFGNSPPEDVAFNIKLTANNITLDLSGVSDLPYEIQELFEKIGRLDQLSLSRATINTSYNSSKLFRFNVDGMTSLANIKINVSATVNEMFPERSVFQACSLTISNLSPEVQRMIGVLQAETGFIMPMVNGSVTFDIKDMLNAGQNPFGGF